MAYKEYLKILDISESNKNSFVSISIKHLSPYIAKDWLNIIIFNINESMREEDKKNANKAITFLSEASSSTNIKTILDKNSLLLENQIQNLMLASSNESYIFKSLDPPFIPEKKSSPARAIICITGFFIGLFCSLVFIFYQYYRNLFVNNDA
jgi:capsular polysaccharide biosynthesis protein